jgi:predicted DNA-binding transcriptional regulator YafY
LWVESQDLAVLFVLTMGASAVIVEPDDLREKVIHAVHELLETHHQ